MHASELEGGFANAPHEASTAFRGAMRAMAMPGTIEVLSGADGPAPLSCAASTLLLTLCDPETPLYLAGGCDVPAVRAWITFHTGAPLVGPDAAMFAVGPWADLMPCSAYGIGTPEYPDRSATLIVEMSALENDGACLSGPGIQSEAFLNLPDIQFSKANAALYPLGIDLFLTHGDRVAALPRTTKVR